MKAHLSECVLERKTSSVNQSQSLCQSVLLKRKQLPHIRNDSSPHGSACMSAVRTVAITGDDSEADIPHKYCHPPRVLDVGVGAETWASSMTGILSL